MKPVPSPAAHASGTAALLPMLALGIPGSGTAAILLGGLMVWGLNPGPLLFVEHKDFVWGLIASMYLGNVVGLVLVLTTVPIFASILRVPFAAVAPMIVVSCAIGAYAIQNAMFDIWLMLGFGVVGYVFKKIGIPLAPFTLALVLGNRAEDAFRLSMIGSGGDMKVFWSNGWIDHDARDRSAVLAGNRQGVRQRRAAVAAGKSLARPIPAVNLVLSNTVASLVALVWIATIHVIFRAHRPYAHCNSVTYAELSSVRGSGPPPRCSRSRCRSPCSSRQHLLRQRLRRLRVSARRRAVPRCRR
jgi:hypothetical protein